MNISKLALPLALAIATPTMASVEEQSLITLQDDVQFIIEKDGGYVETVTLSMPLNIPVSFSSSEQSTKLKSVEIVHPKSVNPLLDEPVYLPKYERTIDNSIDLEATLFDNNMILVDIRLVDTMGVHKGEGGVELPFLETISMNFSFKADKKEGLIGTYKLNKLSDDKFGKYISDDNERKQTTSEFKVSYKILRGES
ncbi:hypothetical protein [Vibrio sp. D431a]|uniref:hypothetical protein n=1 Tax=Vibrio sp. D431a TaxID=2837388 RepID=UPI002554FBF8|nr:hypothetical protein [Vibrio sp. D431a]MDK9790156.1 hypothetical protein [Vibrio sp. D431a]